jgi:hypothetical protein
MNRIKHHRRFAHHPHPVIGRGWSVVTKVPGNSKRVVPQSHASTSKPHPQLNVSKTTQALIEWSGNFAK